MDFPFKRTGICNLRPRLKGRQFALSANAALADTRRLHTRCCPLRAGDEAFAPGLTAGNSNLAHKCPDGTLQLCAPKVRSAVLLVSHIINSTQRFAFCVHYFEHSPSNVPRLTDTTVHFAYFCTREGDHGRLTRFLRFWLG